jgi:hypothetical protein
MTCITSCVGDVVKALADPTRRAIVDELTDRKAQTPLWVLGGCKQEECRP